MNKSTKQAIAEEIKQIETAIETCKKGQAANDDDGEWAVMQQCYEEGLAALRRIQETLTKSSTLTVVLEGGLLNGVYAKDPNIIGFGYDLIDYDSEGADKSEIGSVRQSDGSISEAVIGGGYVEELGVEIVDDEDAS